MWRTLLPAIVLLISSVMLSGQDTDVDEMDSRGITSSSGETDERVVEQRDENRLKTGLEVGTTFSYAPDYYYGTSLYLAPRFTYMLTPKLSVSAGIALEQGRYYPLYAGAEDNFLPMTRAFLYSRLSYYLTPRIVVYAEGYSTINDVARKNIGQTVPYGSYQGIDLGVNYKITDAFSIGVEMRMTNGYYSPYNTGLIPPDAYVPVPGF